MRKEDMINTKPEDLTSDACITFDTDSEFKKEYEKKWDTQIECTD